MKEVLLIFTVLILFLIVGCDNVDLSKLSDEDLERISEKAVVCNKPYIRVGVGCCLDKNGNKICDKDETDEVEENISGMPKDIAEQKALKFVYEHTSNKEIYDKEVTVKNYISDSWKESNIWHVIAYISHTSVEVLVYDNGSDNIKVLTKTDYWKKVLDIPEEEKENEEETSEKEKEKTEEEIISEDIIRIGLQGGYLEPEEGTYRDYESSKISYLCYNIEDSSLCKKKDLSITDMEKQLSKAIENRIKSSKITVTILDEKVVVKEDSETYEFNYPLGELYKVNQEIIDAKATSGEFDQLSYMIAHHGLYRIEKVRPYPDEIYKLNKQDSNYKFQFTIQGEPLK